MPETRILIIGGGSSGLSVAGALKREGLNAVVLDKDAKTGDMWRGRYDNLHLHTIKGLSHSAYKKLDKSLPRYVSKDDFADYLSKYAQEFDVDIRHNCLVDRIHKADYGYEVVTADGDIWRSKHCIIATGINREGFIPDWPETDVFQGDIVHAMHYKRGSDYEGQRVLVVGIGNSGAEICADLVQSGASYVANSIRTFPTIVPRDPLGIPIHVWGVGLFPFPTRFKDWLIKQIVKWELGDLSDYGLQSPEWTVFRDGRIPMIDVGYVKQLKQGHINIKPRIAEFTEAGVRFIDGSHEIYDTIIAATGYRTGLETILDIPDVIDNDGTVIVPNGAETHHKGLWFVGLVGSPAGVLMAARIQARKIAKAIAEQELKPPK